MSSEAMRGAGVRGEPLYIVGIGAGTAVGRDAWSSAAAVRAGISGFVHHPYVIDSAGKPVCVAMAPWLEPALDVAGRLGALLAPAIEQAVAAIEGGALRALRIGLAIGLPPSRPGLDDDLPARVTAAVRARYSGLFGEMAFFTNGHAAGALALQHARDRIAQGLADLFVIAGVDSYVDPDTLEWLEENGQLHGAGELNTAWGFVPGEAAGAILVTHGGFATHARLAPLSALVAIETAQERNRIKSDTVCTGEGLTCAVRQAVAHLPAGATVTDLYCDLNGEPYRADEYGFTCLRTKAGGMADFVAPADCWGDVGAAGLPLHLIAAAVAAMKGYARGAIALVCASAEDGARAAVLSACTGEARHGRHG